MFATKWMWNGARGNIIRISSRLESEWFVYVCMFGNPIIIYLHINQCCSHTTTKIRNNHARHMLHL